MILIFGGGSGIGYAIAQELVSQKRDVLLLGRSHGRLIEAAQLLGRAFEVCDARQFDQVEDVFRRYPHAEGAVNCAGSIVLKPAHLTSEKDFQEAVDTNLKTSFAVARAAGKHLQGGSVLFFSSAAARYGLPNHELIAACKSAVQGLALSAAATYAARGLRFNVIAPGLVDTPLAERITSRPASLAASQAQHPLGRIGTPQEVASLACWLLGPNATWVTGQVFGMDGGLATVKPKD